MALIGAIYSRIAPFFALNRIFFPAYEEATLKTKQPIGFQGFFKITNRLQENERQRVSCDKFCNFCFQNSYFPPPPQKKKLDVFNFRPVQYCINKTFELLSPVVRHFQNGCNKEVIEPRVVQFWSEIILVISNRTRVARSFDLEITRMISAQVALHSVQLPL